MTGDQARAERIEELAARCLERLAAEGEAVVAQICADDSELIEPVRSVLRQLESAGLTEPVPTVEQQQLGDFRLLRKLGQGGMGVVWLAEQRSLHRKVALKLLQPVFQQDARVRERFRREVHALSKLDHPNICTVYEAGEIEGQPYLAMRFVPGQSLASLLAEKRRQPDLTAATPRSPPMRQLLNRLHLIEKVARALHAAHQAGVVHRDVKPGNILIDDGGEPVVVDFGLAWADDPALSALTQSGEPLGTPAYMTPEQVTGRGDIDRSTDVYALAATLYECVTLHAPFEASNRDSLYRSILRDSPPDPRKFNRAVGSDLRAVLEKAMEKSPRRRYATALDFAEELRRIREHQPIRTRSTGPLLRAARWCQRNPAATVVLAIVSVALVVALWSLRQRAAAVTRYQSVAMLDQADAIAQVDLEQAFLRCREALDLASDPADVEPEVIVRIQQMMFRLRESRVIRGERQRLTLVQFSPLRDLVISGPGLPPQLFDDQGELLGELRHRTQVTAFSPSRREIAVADSERAGLVFLYSLDADLHEPFAEVGHQSQEQVFSIAWSPNGDRLVLGYGNGSASVWTRNGEPAGKLQPVDPTIDGTGISWRCARFLPDGRVVAAGAIWSQNLNHLTMLRGENGRVLGSVWGIQCTDRRMITFPIENPEARLWTHDGELLWEHGATAGSREFVSGAEFDAKGERFAVGFANGRVDLLDAEDGNRITYLWPTQRRSGGKPRFSPDGEHMAVPCGSGSVEVVEIVGPGRQHLAGHQGHVFSVAFTPDGSRLISAGFDGKARMWWPWKPYPGVPQVLGKSIPDCARARNGIVVTTGDGMVRLCDHEAKTLQKSLVADGTCMVSIDGRGTQAVIASFAGPVYIWDLRSGSEPREIFDLGRDGFFSGSGFLEDGRVVLLDGTRPSRVLMSDPVQGAKPVHDTKLGKPSCLAVSKSGRRLVTGYGNGDWQLFALREGKLIPLSQGTVPANDAISSLAFSADEKRLLTGSNNGSVHLWRLEPTERLREFPPHRNAVNVLDFAPGGQRAASSSKDGTVHVFDLESPDDLLVIGTYGSLAVWGVAFADDRRLVTAGMDGSVCWWWLDAEGLREAVKRIRIEPSAEDER